MTFNKSVFLVSFHEADIDCKVLNGWPAVLADLESIYYGRQRRELFEELDDNDRWDGAFAFKTTDDRCIFTSPSDSLAIVRLPEDCDEMIDALVGIKNGEIQRERTEEMSKCNHDVNFIRLMYAKNNCMACECERHMAAANQLADALVAVDYCCPSSFIAESNKLDAHQKAVAIASEIIAAREKG